MAVKGSPTYIWSESERLGGGAFGDVYVGRHRKRGTAVAVKVFKRNLRPEFANLKQREISIVRELKHDKIVRLIAVEDEKVSKESVIVMELCEGGSLQEVMEKPGNMYGLDEDYFLLLLKHLTAGLEYLNSEPVRLVHRDIKPANILIYVKEDNSHVFKLTDFGGSHLMEGGQEYRSMFGTEEYLNPTMFECALIKKAGRSRNQTFDATVDLWSTGVTLYQSATGRLPFRPKIGRKDKDMMYMMIACKEKYVISAVEEDNGDITFSTELPDTCLLSRDLQNKLVPILSGLLDAEKNAQLDFASFFRQADAVTDSEILHVFSASTCQHLRLYFPETHMLPRVQEHLAQYTDLAAKDQLLFYNHTNLMKLVSPTTKVVSFPETTKTNPILCVPVHGTSEGTLPVTGHPIPKAPCAEDGDIQTDAKWTKRCAGYVHYVASCHSEGLLTQRLLRESLYCVRAYLRVKAGRITSSVEPVEDIYHRGLSIISRVLFYLCEHTSTTDQASDQSLCLHCSEQAAGKSGENGVAQCTLCDEHKSVSQYRKELSVLGSRYHGLRSTLRTVATVGHNDRAERRHQSSSVSNLDKYKEDSTSISKQFQDLKNSPSLTHNQQQLNKFAKTKLRQLMKTATDIYLHSVNSTLEVYYKEVSRDIERALGLLAQTKEIEKSFRQFSDKIKAFETDMPHALASHKGISNGNIQSDKPDMAHVRRSSSEGPGQVNGNAPPSALAALGTATLSPHALSNGTPKDLKYPVHTNNYLGHFSNNPTASNSVVSGNDGGGKCESANLLDFKSDVRPKTTHSKRVLTSSGDRNMIGLPRTSHCSVKDSGIDTNSRFSTNDSFLENMRSPSRLTDNRMDKIDSGLETQPSNTIASGGLPRTSHRSVKDSGIGTNSRFSTNDSSLENMRSPRRLTDNRMDKIDSGLETQPSNTVASKFTQDNSFRGHRRDLDAEASPANPNGGVLETSCQSSLLQKSLIAHPSDAGVPAENGPQCNGHVYGAGCAEGPPHPEQNIEGLINGYP